MSELCTKDNPYSKERDFAGARWEHDAAHEDGHQENGYPGGDIVRMKCNNCGLQWKKELAQ